MPILQVLARAYTKPDGLDAAIAFYEKLFGERCKARFPIPPLGLEIASVASVHRKRTTNPGISYELLTSSPA
jgi:hypothetical protein